MSALDRLAQVQHGLRELAAGVDADAFRTQYHSDLSPIGWHLGHCSFIESFWLRTQALGEPVAAELAALYFPEASPKPERGGRLPAQQQLLSWSRRLQRETLQLIAEPPPALAAHPLMRDGYLAEFLIQHHAQHLEIMRMAFCQLPRQDAAAVPAAAVQPRLPSPSPVRLAEGEYTLGSEAVTAYDNEQPLRRVRLRSVRIACQPVANAEYLAFIDSGGYRDPRWWCPAGWRWRQQNPAGAPEHWRRRGSHWFEITPLGAEPLRADAAVLGLNWYEASAFARWAGGRLPHEYEWEAAAGAGLLERVGESWEWCGNRFHPYPGFRAFPYDGYSLPWFDGDHYVLRGGSRYSEACVRRCSFRNFYGPDKRHIFAGLRLVFD